MSILAVKGKTEFSLSFPFNPSLVEAIREIPGKRWDNPTKTWRLPLSAEDRINELIEKYGGQNSDNGTNWEVPELPELKAEIPGLKRPLYPYQGKGVQYCIDKKRVIIGDEPGLGKTSQAIAAILAADKWPVLIVCPSSLKKNWQKELEIVAGEKSMILEPKIKKSWHSFYRAGICRVFIVNYESLRTFFVLNLNKDARGQVKLKDIIFDERIVIPQSVIIDEIHRAKEGKSQVTKILIGMCYGKEYIYGLTGTPVVNAPKDLATQLTILGQINNIAGSYKNFIKRFCAGKDKGSSNLSELRYRLAMTCFYQRKKREVLKDLPELSRQIITCDITTREEYNNALADLSKYLREYKNKSDDQIRQSLRGEIMVTIGICKDISARGKLNEVFEYIDEIMEAGEKVVVFIHQKSVALKLMERYPDCLTIRGADSIEHRNKAQREFQACKICGEQLQYHTDKDHEHVLSDKKLIICSIKAAGVGLTLTTASRVAHVELPWHAADVDQCESRCDRISQRSGVMSTFFLGHQTIDEKIFQIINEKRKTGEEITGNSENVETSFVDKFANIFFQQ